MIRFGHRVQPSASQVEKKTIEIVTRLNYQWAISISLASFILGIIIGLGLD